MRERLAAVGQHLTFPFDTNPRNMKASKNPKDFACPSQQKAKGMEKEWVKGMARIVAKEKEKATAEETTE